MFTADQVMELQGAAGTLLALIAKHASLRDMLGNPVKSRGSTEEIEYRLLRAPHKLSQREIQVCAGILRGVSLEGTATALNIGLETVATYRKRAYVKLGVSCKNELLMWYLSLKKAAT